MQAKYSQYPERCVLGDCPTLSEVSAMYGRKVSHSWLVIQLSDLNEYAGARERMTTEQVAETARVIYLARYGLKLSELTLFFSQLKEGRYGAFYGVVDPMQITRALTEFMRYRADVIDRQANERRRKELEERLTRGGCCTREEYNGMEQVEIPVRVIVDTPALQEALHPRRHGVNDNATITIKKDRLADVWKFVENGQISVLR